MEKKKKKTLISLKAASIYSWCGYCISSLFVLYGDQEGV